MQMDHQLHVKHTKNIVEMKSCNQIMKNVTIMMEKKLIGEMMDVIRSVNKRMWFQMNVTTLFIIQ